MKPDVANGLRPAGPHDRLSRHGCPTKPFGSVSSLCSLSVGLLLGGIGTIAPAAGESVAYWRFEDRLSGEVPADPSAGGSVPDTILDSSGNGNHMQTWTTATAPAHTTVVGPPFGALGGVAGTGALNRAALDFTGQPEDIYTASKPINSQAFDAWTVEASFMLDVAGRWQVIVAKDGNPVGGQPPLSLKVRADNRLEIGVVDGGGAARYVIGTTRVETGKWYHAAATATSNTLSLWLKPEGSSTFVPQGSSAIQGAFFNTYTAFNQPWIVGRGMWNGGQADWLDGRVDEVRISDVALGIDQFLGSFSPADSDSDGLSDTWELVYFRETAGEADSTVLAKQSSPWADADSDGYSNLEEFKLGTDPAAPDDLTGKLAREVWFGIPGDLVSDLMAAPGFADGGQLSVLNDGIDLPEDFADDYGQRLRGWITAPVSGDYTFWIAGDNQCELWLSTSESKFDRQLIASVPEWTAPRQWDKFPSQQSAAVPLVAGQRYFIECLHKEGGYADSLSVAWQVPGGVGEVIPPAHLTPYSVEPADQDMDEMPDAWEVATFGSADAGPMDNPDGDYAPNWEEFLFGTNPLGIDSNVGYWRIERWYDMPFYSVPELVSNQDFYGPPAIDAQLHKPAEFNADVFVGTRVRGYVEVDETAEYHFWISARASADLLLSSDETPYRKRRIAYLGVDGGTATGVPWYSGNLWDTNVSQMSEPILLEAGRKYYLEVIRQNGHDPGAHLQVAWAKTDGLRSLIPVRNMSSFVGQPGDEDDDSMPDDWEAAFGLDPADNGFNDIEKQGERGDFDGDGLSNRQEFLAGTDPCEIDSDGDGLSDRDEIRTYGTDPTVSDSSAEQVVQTVSAGSVSGLGTTWIESPDGVMTSSFRGTGSWDFTVPEGGFWIIQVEGKLIGDLTLFETVPVEVSIDSVSIGREAMEFVNRGPGSLRILTPWLAAGGHNLGLFIDNYTARRSLEVTGIKVLRPGGLDVDSDGRSDAVEDRLVEFNQLLPGTMVESYVSPAFVEGLARASDSVEFRIRHEGVGSTIRHKDSFWGKEIARIHRQLEGQADALTLTPGSDLSAAGVDLSTSGGPGRGTWFAEVPLESNQATGYTVFFENGSVADSGVLVWRPINLLLEDEVTIPVNSTLLMSAWDDETDNSRVVFTIGTEVREIRAKESLSWEFDQVGDFEISAWHERSDEAVLFTVRVRDAALPDGMSLVEQRYRTYNLPGVDPDRSLDSHGAVGIGSLEAVVGGGSRIELAGGTPGSWRVAARLEESAAILDMAEVTVIGVSDGLRNGVTTVTPIGDGMYLERQALLITNLPQGATIRIHIFAGGVTFLDGTTTKILTAEDFDENGVFMLEMLKPAERLGAACHELSILDAQGNVIFE